MDHPLKKGVDYVGVGVVFFCHDGKGNFVMAKRGKNSRDEHGNWDIGGGGLEFGDAVDETLKREIREEYCTDVLHHEFLGYMDVHRAHEGNPTHWIALCFTALIDPAKVKNGEPRKFDEIAWFTLKNLPDNVHSQMGKFLELYRDKL